MEGLPAKVQLHEKYQAKGLEVITVNVDGEEGMQVALAALKKQGITTTNWCIAEAMSDEVTDVLQFEFIPVLNIYDRQGRLRETIDEIEPADLESIIERYLNEA